MLRFEGIRVSRDANTLIYAGFPILGYPLLLLLAVQIASYVEGALDKQTPRVAVEAQADAEALAGSAVELVDGDLDAVDQGTIEAFVRRRDGVVEVHHRSGNPLSRSAVGRVDDWLSSKAKQRLEARTKELGVEVYDVKVQNVDPVSGTLSYMFGLLVGLIAPLMLFIASPAPLAEMFVVEREKHTLETLLSTAVGRFELVVARIVIATTITTTATVLNLIAFAFVVGFAVQLLLEDPGELKLITTVWWLTVPVLMASCGLLMSTAVTLIFSLAKTFREAQGLFSVLVYPLFGPLLISTLACIEGWSADLWWAPMCHTSTLIFAAISGQAHLLDVVLAVGIDLALVVLLLGGWHLVFGMESLLVGVERPAWVQRFTGETR